MHMYTYTYIYIYINMNSHIHFPYKCCVHHVGFSFKYHTSMGITIMIYQWIGWREKLTKKPNFRLHLTWEFPVNVPFRKISLPHLIVLVGWKRFRTKMGLVHNSHQPHTRITAYNHQPTYQPTTQFFNCPHDVPLPSEMLVRYLNQLSYHKSARNAIPSYSIFIIHYNPNRHYHSLSWDLVVINHSLTNWIY